MQGFGQRGALSVPSRSAKDDATKERTRKVDAGAVKKEAVVAHQTYNDIRAFNEAHPSPVHEVLVLATDQVNLLCMSCGFHVTADAVDAGLPVRHIAEQKEAKP